MQVLRSLDLAQANTCAMDDFSVTFALAPAATKWKEPSHGIQS
jgi:hypothetical protein